MGRRKDKKKKSLVKRILNWSGITLLLVIIALILIPILFKDQIKEMALNEANKMLLADVALEDFDLTLLSTFPNLTVSFDGVKITGRNEFNKVELVNIKNLEARIGLWSVIGGDQIEINAVHLHEPKIDIRVLENGWANYDIVKPDSVLVEEEVDTEESNFKLQLKEYSINNGVVKYDDRASNLFAELVNLNHTGKGDLTADVINFETSTNMDELTFAMDGLNYLTSVKTEMIVNLLMEFTENSSKFTLKENSIALNAFKMQIDGYYEILEGYDNMDFKINASQTSFKDLLSLIPSFYTMGYEQMASSGNLGLDALLKGRLDEINMPGWDVNLHVADASIAYPDVPGKINNITIAAGSKFEGGDNLDKMTIDVDKFHADFVGNKLDAQLKMRNPMTDPYLKAVIIADIDLSTLEQVMPMAEEESYNGKLVSNINVNGRLSALEKEDYEAFKAEGVLQVDQMKYSSADLPQEVNIETMKFLFSPDNLNLENFSAKMGSSDFNANGTIDNYMAYLFKDEKLHGKFNYSSKNLNIDELMQLSYDEESASSTEIKPSTAEVAPLLIPDNIDFELSSEIDNLVYDGMNIKDVTGDLILRDEQANLSNMKMKALGGDIALTGNYNTKNHTTPKLEFSYDLSKIDINALTSNFLTIEKLAPIGKYAQGIIDSKFTLSTDLMPDFTPIYNTLNGDGTLFTNEVQVAGFKPLEKLSEVMKMKELNEGSFKDVRTSFAIEDGKLRVKPFNLDFGKGISSNVSGTTSLEQDIDYKLAMNVPKELVPKSFVDVAEKAVAQVNKIPGFKINAIPEVINVNAFIVNKITDPKIETNFKEALMEQAGGFKNTVKDLIDDKVTEVKDSVKAVINNIKDNAKEELEAKKKEILDQAQKQADAVKKEAKKAADKVRTEADKQAKNLMDEAGNNPLKKKAAEISGNKLKEKAEISAQKIESNGESKANKIMNEARSKADKIR